MTVVRFFNVYGPHGRPDMMPWQWSRSIHRGEPITLFNGGKMKRMTGNYIDDIVAGFTAAIDHPLGFEILNLGCGNPVENLDFVKVIEKLVGKKATVIDTPAPPSEPIVTYADVSKAGKLIGYKPKVRVEEGLKNFVEWMRKEDLL